MPRLARATPLLPGAKHVEIVLDRHADALRDNLLDPSQRTHHHSTLIFGVHTAPIPVVVLRIRT
jgi:hypothetical protein